MNIIHKSFMAAAALVFLLAVPAFSQLNEVDESLINRSTIGIGLSLAVPLGDFADRADMGIGITGLYSYAYNYNLDFLGSIGYVMWGGKNAPSNIDISWGAIPIQIGIRYLFNVNSSRFYIGGLAGFHIFRYSVKDNLLNTDRSETETKLGIAPTMGYIFPLGRNTRLDISTRYQFVADDFSYLGIRAGIAFRLQ